MKTIGAAVFLILSAQGVLASDFQLPSLKYAPRESGHLPSLPASQGESRQGLFDSPVAKPIASGDVRLFDVKVQTSATEHEKPAGSVSGGLPPSRALDLIPDRARIRARRDYSLISRELLKAETTSQGSSVVP